MNKSLFFVFVLSLIVLYGCQGSDTMTFSKGAERLNEINEKFGSSMKTPPNSEEDIKALMVQITGFAASQDLPVSLEYLIDFRLKNLAAERLHIEGWQWGRGSSIDYGFGCRRGSARILNSSKIRNASAQKGYEAVDALQLFVDEFTEEAKSVNLTQKDVIFLNANIQQVEEKANRDSKTIRRMCKEQIKELNITI